MAYFNYSTGNYSAINPEKIESECNLSYINYCRFLSCKDCNLTDPLFKFNMKNIEIISNVYEKSISVFYDFYLNLYDSYCFDCTLFDDEISYFDECIQSYNNGSKNQPQFVYLFSHLSLSYVEKNYIIFLYRYTTDQYKKFFPLCKDSVKYYINKKVF